MLMNRRCLIVLAFGFYLIPGFSQSPVVPPPPSWLTDYPVFRFFFKHVVKTESYATELLALGKDDSGERHRFKNAIGLTDAEETLLKSVAADADGAITSFDKATTQWRAQYPAGPLSPAALQQLQARTAQRQQIVQDHLNALRASMAADRYQQLYIFVWATEGPRIKLTQPSGSPATNVPPPPKS
jgi:hypothetical protein